MQADTSGHPEPIWQEILCQFARLKRGCEYGTDRIVGNSKSNALGVAYSNTNTNDYTNDYLQTEHTAVIAPESAHRTRQSTVSTP